MTLQDICRIENVDLAHTALVRHNLTNKTVKESCRAEMLDVYQSIQTEGRFDGYDYVMSFLGEDGTSSRFLGCYRICGKEPLNVDSLPEYIRDDLKDKKYHVKWILEKTDIMADYRERLIIDWGPGAINWFHRGTTIKEVMALEPVVSEVTFESYDKVLLSFASLKEIVSHPKQHSVWKKELSRIAAIYLIADKKTGKLYVGSATSEEAGLWSRWSAYAKTGHGNNEELMKLLEDPGYTENFQFSILKVFPLRHDPYDVRKYETLYKQKLLSMKFGLNDN